MPGGFLYKNNTGRHLILKNAYPCCFFVNCCLLDINPLHSDCNLGLVRAVGGIGGNLVNGLHT